jgi:hypothetical protein
LRLSAAVIGMAGEKGPGTVDLLGEHNAGESVW